MTTYAYVGRPGSGKSYSVVEHQIMPAFKSGRRVVTNIPLNMDEIRKVEGCAGAELVEFPVGAVKENPARLTEFVKPGDVFVLDEVSKIWPAGEKVKDVPAEYVSFLTEHRHMVDALGNSVVIILVVQDLGNIGLWALRLVDFTYNHTKLSVVGAGGSYRCDIYEGPVKGPNYPVKRRVRYLVGRYSDKVYKYYKSHTQSESKVAGANEKSMDSRANILKRWSFMIGVPAGIVGIFLGFHFLGKAMDKAKAPPHGAAASTASGAPSAATQPGTMQSWVNGAAKIIEHPPLYRIIGQVVSDSHPEASKVALRGEGSSPLLYVALSKCRKYEGELECPLKGWYYTAAGLSDDPVPVPKSPLGETLTGFTQGPAPPVGGPAAASRSSASSSSSRDESQLEELAKNSAGVGEVQAERLAVVALPGASPIYAENPLPHGVRYASQTRR